VSGGIFVAGGRATGWLVVGGGAMCGPCAAVLNRSRYPPVCALPTPLPRRPFLALLVFAAAQLLAQVGYGIYVIVQFGTSPGDFDGRGALGGTHSVAVGECGLLDGWAFTLISAGDPHVPFPACPSCTTLAPFRSRASAPAVRQTYPYLAGGVFFGLTVAITALAIVALALVVQLLSFHIYLIVHGLTTYDYIVNRAQGGAGASGSASTRAGVASSTKRSSRARSGRGRSQSPQHHKSQAHHHGGQHQLASPSRADPAIAAAAAAAAAEEGGAVAGATTTVTGGGNASALGGPTAASEGAATVAPEAVTVQLHPVAAAAGAPPFTAVSAAESVDLSAPPVPAGTVPAGDGPGGGISVV
jgi:hypothetical protein